MPQQSQRRERMIQQFASRALTERKPSASINLPNASIKLPSGGLATRRRRITNRKLT